MESQWLKKGTGPMCGYSFCVTGTIIIHTLQNLLKGEGAERLMACPECHDVDSSLQSQPLICFKAPSDYQCVWLLSVVSVCS